MFAINASHLCCGAKSVVRLTVENVEPAMASSKCKLSSHSLKFNTLPLSRLLCLTHIAHAHATLNCSECIFLIDFSPTAIRSSYSTYLLVFRVVQSS